MVQSLGFIVSGLKVHDYRFNIWVSGYGFLHCVHLNITRGHLLSIDKSCCTSCKKNMRSEISISMDTKNNYIPLG